MKNKLLIWVLKDDRPGNYNQAINLAELLKIKYEIKEVSYNKLAKLPSFLKFGKFSNIDKESKNNLLNSKNKPDIIISAGRRSSLIALDLKKTYPDLFLIQIMNPVYNLNKFNLIISPKHDNLKGDNVIEIIGSISQINKKRIEKNYKEFADIFDKIKTPKIALLIGGSSKNAKFTLKFTLKDAKNLRNISDKICKSMKANLIGTTSRRTDEFLIKEIEENNKNLKYFFKWQENSSNPYLAILKTADYVIATGDSISMCAEVCNLQNPLFIYANDNICSKKHLKFHQSLFDNNLAIKLSDNLADLSLVELKKIDKMDNIIKEIKENILKSFKLD